MTDKNLFSALGNIDEKYIEEAADEQNSHSQVLVFRILATAAAFLLVVTASIIVFTNPPAKFSPQTESSEFVGLSPENNDGAAAEGDSIGTYSELMLEDESPEDNRPADVGSDTPTDSANSASSKAQSHISTTTNPNSTKGESYSTDIILKGERIYRRLNKQERSSLGIRVITQNDLDEKIGILTDENCEDASLVGSKIFRHKKIDCDALFVVEYNGEFVPYAFDDFKNPIHDFSEILSIYGINSSLDIEKITTSTTYSDEEIQKTVTEAEQIDSVYSILKSIRFDNDESNELKIKYHQEGNKKYIFFTLHFKNGLKYKSFYNIYPNISYIVYHDFLTSEQDEILRNILLN